MKEQYYNLNGEVYYRDITNGKERKISWATRVLCEMPDSAKNVIGNIYITEDASCYYKVNSCCIIELKKKKYLEGKKGCFIYDKDYKEDKVIRAYLSIHSLYAKAFIPNPHNYRYVYAKDGNLCNICCENLEWRKHPAGGGLSLKEKRYKALPDGFVRVPETQFYINKAADVLLYDEFSGEFVSRNPCKNNGMMLISANGTNVRLHVLYAKAFIPNPYNYQYVCAKDGNLCNVSFENLQWGQTNNTVHKKETERRVSTLSDEFVHVEDTNLYINKEAVVFSDRGTYFKKENPFLVERGNSAYYAISVRDMNESPKRTKNYQLHILYAKTFIKKQDEKQDFVAAHNGSVLDINIDNLYWTTVSEYQSMIQTGRRIPTTAKVMRKLMKINMDLVTNERHRIIIEKMKKGMTRKEIATELGVSAAMINLTINTWYKKSIGYKPSKQDYDVHHKAGIRTKINSIGINNISELPQPMLKELMEGTAVSNVALKYDVPARRIYYIVEKEMKEIQKQKVRN